MIQFHLFLVPFNCFQIVFELFELFFWHHFLRLAGLPRDEDMDDDLTFRSVCGGKSEAQEEKEHCSEHAQIMHCVTMLYPVESCCKGFVSLGEGAATEHACNLLVCSSRLDTGSKLALTYEKEGN